MDWTYQPLSISGVIVTPINSAEAGHLLGRARRLDRNALGQIHDHFFPEVYHYVLYRLGDEQTSLAIASKVFFSFLEALHRRPYHIRNIQYWLIDAAGRTVEEYLRQQADLKKTPPSSRLRLPIPEPEPPQAASGDNPAPAEPGSRLFCQALQKLPPSQQHLLAVRFAQNRSLEETAVIMGKSIQQVKKLEYAGFSALQKLLQDDVLQSQAPK
ncbi:MAG: sigma-70 family RNA polymerase sigma factor [Anaerolineales bacterium]|nr:sigma-70 family RNA polymerase sigma factor [Anaerolineales bacterium]